MKKNFKLLAKYAVCVALVLAFGACSAPAAEEAGGPIEGTAYSGGAMIIGIAQDLDASFDPHQMIASGTAGTRELMFNVFEGLVRPMPDGTLVPAVAAAVEVDGARYTFTLREGVQFHNGAPVTVDDVVYSLDRARDSAQTATFITALGAIASVQAIDEETVVIELYEADNAFLAFLTVPIIPAGYENQAQSPIGTGPFRFVSHTPQEALVLERFDAYWGTPAYLDEVTVRIFASGEAMALALQAGAIDLAGHLTYDMVQGIGADFYYVGGSMNLVQALFLNNEHTPFDDVRVRRAMHYAVDVGQIMDLLSGGIGHPLGSMMHPAFTRYFHEGLVDLYPHDPARARELLAEAGVADGFSFTITVPGNYTPHVITAEVLVEQLRAVGIEAELNLVEWAYWVSEVNQARNFEATVIGIAARDLTARSMLERFVTDNGRNFINFNSAAYDELFWETQAEEDAEAQVALYRALQEMLAYEAASVFLQDLTNFVAMRETIAGFTFYPIYVLDLARLHFVA